MSESEKPKGTIYRPDVDQVDDWSKAIYQRLVDWPAARNGKWERWEPGYLVLTITSDQGGDIEPVVLDTYEDELTITFGYWETHAPSHVPSEMSDDEAAAEEAKKFVDGWIGGQLFTAIYFDAAGKWCGSITVEPDEIADRVRWGEEWIRNFQPARVELRRPRRADWRYFVVSGSEIEEVAGPPA